VLICWLLVVFNRTCLPTLALCVLHTISPKHAFAVLKCVVRWLLVTPADFSGGAQEAASAWHACS
jgi:hypothetical protein